MSAPVRHTCPKIDDVISAIKTVISWSDANFRNDAMDIDSAKEDFYEITKALKDCEYELEDLRSDNDSLRTWGHTLEDTVEKLEGEIETLQNQLNEALA